MIKIKYRINLWDIAGMIWILGAVIHPDLIMKVLYLSVGVLHITAGRIEK